MHVYTRLAVLVVVVLINKCSAWLDGVFEEHEPHTEGNGISQVYEKHREDKGISLELETYREEKVIYEKDEEHIEEKTIQRQNKNLSPLLESFFGIIDFDSANCTVGECLSQSDCVSKNGAVSDHCAQGFGVCCFTMDATRDYRGGDNIITGKGGLFFNAPSAAAGREDVVQREYTAKMFPTPDAVQIIVNMTWMSLLGPVNGECIHDSLEIKGANPGYKIPILCGFSCHQHLYIPIDYSSGPYQIIIKTSNIPFDRNWDFRVKFLSRTDKLVAPRGCLQYHTDMEGSLKSFNTGGDVIHDGRNTAKTLCLNYFGADYKSMALNDQTYSICFGSKLNQPSRHCTVKFNIHVDLRNNHFNCTENFLYIGNSYYCGYTYVTDNATSPNDHIVVKVKTDSKNELEAGGFVGYYQMMGC